MVHQPLNPFHVESAQWCYHGDDGQRLAHGPGRPTLELAIGGGQTLFIDSEQKLLAAGLDLVALGGDPGDDLGARLVPIPYGGRDGINPGTLEGGTDDPAVVRLVRQFCEAVRAGRFTPRVVPV